MKTHIKNVIVGYYEYDLNENYYISYIDNSLIAKIDASDWKFIDMFDPNIFQKTETMISNFGNNLFDCLNVAFSDEKDVDTVLLLMPIGVFDIKTFIDSISNSFNLDKRIFKVSTLKINKFTKKRLRMDRYLEFLELKYFNKEAYMRKNLYSACPN